MGITNKYWNSIAKLTGRTTWQLIRLLIQSRKGPVLFITDKGRVPVIKNIIESDEFSDVVEKYFGTVIKPIHENIKIISCSTFSQNYYGDSDFFDTEIIYNKQKFDRNHVILDHSIMEN